MTDAMARKSDESRALWFLGGLYEVLIAAEDTGGKATVMRMTAPAGTGSPPHTHDGDELLYVLDGQIDCHIGDDVVSAGPGTTFSFPAGTLEWFEATTQATVLVTYTPGGIDKFFVEVAEPAATRTLPPPLDAPPDFEHIVQAAGKYGLTIQSPR